MAIAGELPEGGTQKATFRKGAEGAADQRGGLGGDQGGEKGDGGETGAVECVKLYKGRKWIGKLQSRREARTPKRGADGGQVVTGASQLPW